MKRNQDLLKAKAGKSYAEMLRSISSPNPDSNPSHYLNLIHQYQAKIDEFSRLYKITSSKLDKKKIQNIELKNELEQYKLENIALKEMLRHNSHKPFDSLARNSLVAHTRTSSQDIQSLSPIYTETPNIEGRYEATQKHLDIAVACLKNTLYDLRKEKNTIAQTQRLQNMADRWEVEVRNLELEKSQIERELKLKKVHYKV